MLTNLYQIFQPFVNNRLPYMSSLQFTIFGLFYLLSRDLTAKILLFIYLQFYQNHQMQDQKAQNQSGSAQPFLIVKNARKAVKKKQQRRKQSYQYPTAQKKTRRMTIQLSQLHSLIEENSPVRCPSLNFEAKEEQIEEVANNEEQMVNIMQGVECREEDEQQEPEDNIPFSCNEWQLDKESPYLKNFNSMVNQIEEFRLDE